MRQTTKHQMILFICFVVLFGIFTKPYVTSGNSASRFATMQALIEENTLSIDNTMFIGNAQSFIINQTSPLMRRDSVEGINGTNDKAFIDGKYYSDKPITLSLIGAGLYSVLYHFFGLSFNNNGPLVVYILTFLLAAIPGALIIIVFYRLLYYCQMDNNLRFFMSALLGVSTLILPYSTVLNNHIPATLLIGIAILQIFNIRFLENNKDVRSQFIYLGICLSLTTVIDMVIGGIFMVFTLIYLLCLKSTRNLVPYFVVALLPAFILHAMFTIPLTGDLKPASMHPEFWDYPGSGFNVDTLTGVKIHHASFMDWLMYSFHSLLGYRGLMSYTPLLVIGSFFLIAEIFHRKKYFAEAMLIGTSSIFVILYYLLTSDNYGGWAYGMRWFVPLVPGIFFFTAFAFKKTGYEGWKKIGLYATVAWSILFALVGTYEPWTNMWRTPISFVNNLYLLLKELIR